MQAKDIMTQNVISLRQDNTIYETIDILIDNEISAAPVIEDERIIGLVSEKDLLVSVDFIGKEKAGTIKVSDFMSTDLVTASEDTPIEEIGKILVRNSIKRVPIVKDNTVVGIVSRCDVLRALRKK